MPDRPRYCVFLEPDPSASYPAVVGLRRLLKTARRAYGLKCVGYHEVAVDGDPNAAVAELPRPLPAPAETIGVAHGP
jgi:hypothetical protein